MLVCRRYDLSPDQIEALRQFVAGGGKLVLQHAEAAINFAPLAEVLRVSDSRLTLWDWAQPPPLAAPLCGAEGERRGVRFTAFAAPGPEPRRVVLHALNYNVSLLEPSRGEVTPVEDLSLRVPVPSVWKRARATVYDPDTTGAIEVQCSVDQGVAQISLPALRIYQMVELAAE